MNKNKGFLLTILVFLVVVCLGYRKHMCIKKNKKLGIAIVKQHKKFQLSYMFFYNKKIFSGSLSRVSMKNDLTNQRILVAYDSLNPENNVVFTNYILSKDYTDTNIEKKINKDDLKIPFWKM